VTLLGEIVQAGRKAGGGWMADWVPGDTINCVYFAMVAIGLVWTVISLIGADFDTDVDLGGPDFDFHVGEFDVAGVHIPGVDLGVDSPDVDVGSAVHLPSISPFAIAAFVTGFGAGGIISNLAFGVSAAISLLWATLGGVLVGGAMQFLFGAVLLKSQGSSEVRVSQLAGTRAEVTVPISEGSNGQIAFVVQGRRVTYGARAADNLSISRGEQVEIVRVVGGTAVVRRAVDEE
jgi:membrane protein implicated in regulation of membrane protease activity